MENIDLVEEKLKKIRSNFELIRRGV